MTSPIILTETHEEQTERQESQKSLTTRYDYHLRSIFLPVFVRKLLKCVSQDSLLDSCEKIFTINQCVSFGCDAAAKELESSSSGAPSLISLPFEADQASRSVPPVFKLAELAAVMELPIDAKRLAALCFPEYLIFSCNKDPAMHSFSKEPVNSQDAKDLLNPDKLVTVGGFSINIMPNGADEINVFVSSKFSCSDEKIATLSILAKTNAQLRTIEEKRIEELHNPKTGQKVVRLELTYMRM